jgi:hypothetical protein
MTQMTGSSEPVIFYIGISMGVVVRPILFPAQHGKDPHLAHRV